MVGASVRPAISREKLTGTPFDVVENVSVTARPAARLERSASRKKVKLAPSAPISSGHTAEPQLQAVATANFKNIFKKMISFIEHIAEVEDVNDPAIFKAIFLAGEFQW